MRLGRRRHARRRSRVAMRWRRERAGAKGRLRRGHSHQRRRSDALLRCAQQPSAGWRRTWRAQRRCRRRRGLCLQPIRRWGMCWRRGHRILCTSRTERARTRGLLAPGRVYLRLQSRKHGGLVPVRISGGCPWAEVSRAFEANQHRAAVATPPRLCVPMENYQKIEKVGEGK